MKSKVYDVLKELCMRVIPAIIFVLTTIDASVPSANLELALIIITAIEGGLGIYLGIDTAIYKKKNDIVVIPKEEVADTEENENDAE